jgi:hypothetical protein
MWMTILSQFHLLDHTTQKVQNSRLATTSQINAISEAANLRPPQRNPSLSARFATASCSCYATSTITKPERNVQPLGGEKIEALLASKGNREEQNAAA